MADAKSRALESNEMTDYESSMVSILQNGMQKKKSSHSKLDSLSQHARSISTGPSPFHSVAGL
jgi:hypothetical protein